MLETLIAGIIYGNVNLSYNHTIWPNGITFGNSVAQNEQLVSEPTIGHREEVRPRERVERASTTSSYTGQGRDIKIVGRSYDQCVIYFKKQTGISRSLGYAGRIPPQGQEAKIGSGALEYNHISLVIADYGDSVRVRESNYWRGYITERTIEKSYIRGYLYN